MIHNILSDAVLFRAGKIVSACFVALLLSGCKDYSFARGTAALPPETPGFLSNLADEYQVLGDYAAGWGFRNRIAFKQRRDEALSLHQELCLCGQIALRLHRDQRRSGIAHCARQ